MKCEIIDGQLLIKPTTQTEEWALKQFFDGIPSYRSAHDFFRIDHGGELVIHNNPPKSDDFDPFGPQS